jgi:ubiquinone/menaquinone biosynthesis C-methylase UbiE
MDKDVELFYDNIAKTYFDHNDRVCDKIVEYFLLDNLPKNKKLKILDAGGGIGRFSKPLLKLGHKVILSDISIQMLNEAKNNLSTYSNIKFIKNSVIDMKEFKDNSFDVVIMINAILDYCEDYNKAMQETYRILKKGGLFIATVNNRFIYCKRQELKEEKYKLFKINMTLGDRHIIWKDQKKGHVSHEFTLEELEKSLLKNKFKIIKKLGVFNLMDKYDMDKINKKNEFIKLQIEFAKKKEYINNSQDYFFVAKK